MTRQEAIKILDAIYFMDDEKQEALRVAIRSLKAWDKVIDTMQLFYTYSECKHTVKSCMSIVNKYMKEVEDEHTD